MLQNDLLARTASILKLDLKEFVYTGVRPVGQDLQRAPF